MYENTMFLTTFAQKSKKTEGFSILSPRAQEGQSPLINVRKLKRHGSGAAGGRCPVHTRGGAGGTRQGAAASRMIQGGPNDADEPNGVPAGDPPTSLP